jgi:hypothetical protein
VAAQAARAVLLAMLATAARGENRYVVDQLTVPVSAQPDGTGDSVATVRSGDKLEVLESRNEFVRVRVAGGQEGWLKAEYLSNDPPLRQKLAEREQEAEKLKREVGELRNELARREAAPVSAPVEAAHPVESPAPAQDPPLLGSRDSELSGPRWSWLTGGVTVALVLGFALGWRALDRRIRKRYGGLRIY